MATLRDRTMAEENKKSWWDQYLVRVASGLTVAAIVAFVAWAWSLSPATWAWIVSTAQGIWRFANSPFPAWFVLLLLMATFAMGLVEGMDLRKAKSSRAGQDPVGGRAVSTELSEGEVAALRVWVANNNEELSLGQVARLADLQRIHMEHALNQLMERRYIMAVTAETADAPPFFKLTAAGVRHVVEHGLQAL